MPASYGREGLGAAEDVDRYWYAEALAGGPEPVDRLVVWRDCEKSGRQANAEHSRLVEPGLEALLCVGSVGVEEAHDGEARRVSGGSFEGGRVAEADDRRR